jgi:hypothetical protein
MRKGENIMTYRNLLTIASIIALIFGLGFILMPGQLVSFYNVELTPAGILIAQLYGATLLGFGLLNWFARGFSDNATQQAILTANLVGDALGSIFSLMGQLGGVPGVNALGWSTVLIYVLLTLGFAYLRFISR